MRLFGQFVSILGPIILPTSWDELRKALEVAYAKYRTSLKSQMNSVFVCTLVAGEDKRFYRHAGIDLLATMRALWQIATRQTWSGGSTIEQQLVRTLTHRYERSLRRKVREMMLATLVETVIPKLDIPGVYLSLAYFGWRMNGIEQAAKRLGISTRNATFEQAAALIARLKYPEPRIASQRRARQITDRSEYLLKVVEKA